MRIFVIHTVTYLNGFIARRRATDGGRRASCRGRGYFFIVAAVKRVKGNLLIHELSSQQYDCVDFAQPHGLLSVRGGVCVKEMKILAARVDPLISISPIANASPDLASGGRPSHSRRRQPDCTRGHDSLTGCTTRCGTVPTRQLLLIVSTTFLRRFTKHRTDTSRSEADVLNRRATAAMECRATIRTASGEARIHHAPTAARAKRALINNP
ncbi:hypothetical protein EVAR_22811_1 [Eumeta japonica]|uniref:Uncharacterized protein n=1 Tax=Eumeta variegata TaxID=151549 RepID=A0A4C1VEQ8_EUMVA|nr:hypothetical protein EVAR_22811_1 [Eumeta japonica]